MDFKAIWKEIVGWFQDEWNAFSAAELALLKSEIPQLTKAGAKALEDFIIQEATSLEQTVLGGSQKASTLGGTIATALATGLEVIDGEPLTSNAPLSDRLMKALIEAGATAAKIGLLSFL